MKVWVLLTCIDEWSRADPNPKGKTLVFSTIENVYHYLKDEMAFEDDESVFLDRMRESDHDWRQWMVDDGHRIVARHSFSLQRYDVDAYYDELQARRTKAKPHRKPRPEPDTQFTGQIDEVDTW